MAAFARRYSQTVDFYQLWDEPNIAPHWGAQPVDPAGYLGLLREGFLQVRAVDPTAWVLAAGLAPTVETGGANLSDVAYLEQLYQLGAAEYFDIAAAKPYGFDVPPNAIDQGPNVLHFGRVSELREVMERFGDASTPLWAVEFGWNALPPGWIGGSSIWGQVDEATQAQHITEAFQQAAQDWPWMGPMLWACYQPDLPAEDARWGFALVDRQGQPRPALASLVKAASAPTVLPPGVHATDHPALRYDGGWRVTPDGADVGATGDRLEFDFLGTRLDLDVRRGPYWAYLSVTVDGRPANALPQDVHGRANLVLYDPLSAQERITLARDLRQGAHKVQIVATGGWGQWPLRRIVVSRERPTPSLWPSGGLALLALLIACNGVRIAVRPETRQSLGWVRERLEHALSRSLRWDDRWVGAAAISTAALFALSRSPLLDLLSLGLLALILSIRSHLVLPLIAFAIPFFLRPKALLGRYFSHLEILTILGAAFMLVDWIRHRSARRRLQITALDWSVLAFVGAAAISVLSARNMGVAQREFRVVILESALLYLLVSRLHRDAARRTSDWLLLDGLALGALAISCVGLWQLVSGQGRVDVEGVWRIRSLYGSPNNLGLYLGRIVPILAAVATFGHTRWRRWAYGLLLIPIGLTCVLTFSKGALLLGLPAAILFLGLIGSLFGRRGSRWWPLALAVIVLLAIGLSLIPLLATERFAGLFDLSQGTGFIRLQLWRGALNMALDRPFLGVGLDNFLYEYRTRYVLPTAWEELNLSHPHNIVLDFWTRLGLMGLVAGVSLFASAFRSGWRLCLRAADGDQRAILLGLTASLVATVAHGLIDNSVFLVDLAFVFMIALGIFRRHEAPGDVGQEE